MIDAAVPRPSTSSPNEQERSYRILVYAPERVGLTLAAPKNPLKRRNYELIFETYASHVRLNEFDAVIYFQGIFESFKLVQGFERHLSHSCDQNQLDKRKKELQLLLNAGGFTCCLLHTDFIDRDDGRDYSATDLAKYQLNIDKLRRENFSYRATHLNVKVDELRPFLEVHGAASAYFYYYGDSIKWRELATCSSRCVGMTIDRSEFFIPTLIPDNRIERIEEYFDLLANGLVLLRNKVIVEIPPWVKSFTFNEEPTLLVTCSLPAVPI